MRNRRRTARASCTQLDPEVEANRAYLRSLLEPLSEFIKEYKNAAELNNNAVLKTPSLAVWAHSKSFLGNEPASRALHIGAARLDVVASTFCDVGAKPVRGTVKNLNAAEKALQNALATIDAYEKAASDLPEAVAKATNARKAEKNAEKELEEGEATAMPMRLEELHRNIGKTEKAALAAEKNREAVAEKLKTALNKSKDGFEEVLQNVDRLLLLAFETRAEGLTAVDQAVDEASKMNGNAKAVRQYKPSDKKKPKDHEEWKVDEAKRLLASTVEELEAWMKEENNHSLFTLHGPKAEDTLLTTLCEALKETSTAKPVISAAIAPDLGKRQADAAAAAKKFAEAVKSFDTDLTFQSSTIEAAGDGKVEIPMESLCDEFQKLVEAVLTYSNRAGHVIDLEAAAREAKEEWMAEKRERRRRRRRRRWRRRIS